MDSAALLRTVDAYLDAVPRADADVEEVGPFTLFVGRSVWPYYARPRHGATVAVTARDVEILRKRHEALGLQPAIEWVGELAPSLAGAAQEAGLAVTPHQLLVLRPGDLKVEHATSAEVREATAGGQDLEAGRAVAELAFGDPGTARGTAGPAERDAAVAATAPNVVAHLRERTRTGLTWTSVAVDPDAGVVAVGSCQPVGNVAEIVGVGTLPSARRQGLAAAVTSHLAVTAFARGVELLLLTAGDDDVARVYARLGFRRVATGLRAEGKSQA